MVDSWLLWQEVKGTGSILKGLLIRLLKCFLSRALMLLFSFRRVEM